jgi:predicted dithiol-disulfide oxidoreductase (DUF899 family)
MPIARHPNESASYGKVRDELQAAELALRDQRERVAALRRRLPQDTPVEDCIFQEIRDGSRVPVRLSELFEDPTKPLVLVHFMYGKKQEQACPMCTMWADGYDGTVPHLRRRVNFAVLVAGDAATIGAWGRSRGWRHLRIVSAADSALKRQLGFEEADGAQYPGVSVFVRRPDGTLVHFYSQSAWYGGKEFRGMDLLSPVWHFFDLTPEGREDWFPSRRYDD